MPLLIEDQREIMPKGRRRKTGFMHLWKGRADRPLLRRKAESRSQVSRLRAYMIPAVAAVVSVLFSFFFCKRRRMKAKMFSALKSNESSV
jgi:hypothetical protein